MLGHTVSGVWPPKCDVTDVNAADVTSDGRLVATADDFGMVKLFNYPALVSLYIPTRMSAVWSKLLSL